ncbi:MAG: hypothetical protein ABJN24_07700 [Hyphomicrobiales bacterium]
MKKTLNTVAGAGLAAMMVTSAQAGPVEHLASQKLGELVCYNEAKTFCAENLRNNGATAFDLKTAADHSFNGRVAILVHGGELDTVRAAFAAAHNISKRGIDIRFVTLPDNDNDPSDAKVEVFSNGLPSTTAILNNPKNQKQYDGIFNIIDFIALDAFKLMKIEEEEAKEKAETKKKSLPQN